MRYKNVAGRFFGLVTKHTCHRQTDGRTDRLTDRITTPKTTLAWLRCYRPPKSPLEATEWSHLLLIDVICSDHVPFNRCQG